MGTAEEVEAEAEVEDEVEGVVAVVGPPVLVFFEH